MPMKNPFEIDPNDNFGVDGEKIIHINHYTPPESVINSMEKPYDNDVMIDDIGAVTREARARSLKALRKSKENADKFLRN